MVKDLKKNHQWLDSKKEKLLSYPSDKWGLNLQLLVGTEFTLKEVLRDKEIARRFILPDVGLIRRQENRENSLMCVCSSIISCIRK